MIPANYTHFVNGRLLMSDYPEYSKQAVFGMGCFWGAERLFWQIPGVHVTAVGYSGGHVANPSYRHVCSGMTGHAEVVLVVFDPGTVSYEDLLTVFWENHDPTQGMRQGHDIGTQYRSVIQVFDERQDQSARASRKRLQAVVLGAGFKSITTEIVAAAPFYFAEVYHQQHLARNPDGYCGLISLPVSLPPAT